jgi:ribonucleoside-diphosphate reductase beta chain
LVALRYPAYGLYPANAVPGNKIQDSPMAYTTFSQTKNDQLKEPMFFGQPVNVARYDQQKYDIFEKLIEKQLSFFWRPEEVTSRDRID